ncbi:MAG: hypothetical protein M1831_002966 [Alyxoria varia]|nr:MAG: hypothetical protein M1831_002966 [Alyxoria varia]
MREELAKQIKSQIKAVAHIWYQKASPGKKPVDAADHNNLNGQDSHGRTQRENWLGHDDEGQATKGETRRDAADNWRAFQSNETNDIEIGDESSWADETNYADDGTTEYPPTSLPLWTFERRKALQESDLIFPTAHTTSIHALTSSISKSTLSLSNRLHSIAHDSSFVSDTASLLALEDAVIANERCGGWYVDPARKAGSSYFKSTDGHEGQWAFSCRRLNLGVLRVVGEHGGGIVVDSTRRGKHLPDALAKTIPIWCAVLNRLLFPEVAESHSLVVLPEIVSASEKSRMEAKLDEWVENAKRLELPLDSLRSQARKPLIPRFMVRSLGLHPGYDPHEERTPEDRSQNTFNPLFLLMASSFQHSSGESPGHSSRHAYVQGAGDDAESWACGLTPEIFWLNKHQLRSSSEVELPSLLSDLTSGITRARSDSGAFIGDGSRARELCLPKAVFSAQSFSVSIGDLDCDISRLISGDCDSNVLIILACTEKQIPGRFKEVMNEQETQACTEPKATPSNILHLECRDGKLGSKDLRNELRKVQSFLEDTYRADETEKEAACEQVSQNSRRQYDLPPFTLNNATKRQTLIYILSPKSSDLPIGITLTILCLYDFSTSPGDSSDPQSGTSNPALDRNSLRRRRRPFIDKPLIRKILAEITTNLASLDARAINPSRATLNAVNAYLMSPG